jgi:hypothetical protein
VKIVDPAFAKRCGERCLGEARTSRGGHGANVDQELDPGGGKLRQKLVDRLAFISDREELPSRHRSAVTTILDTMHRQRPAYLPAERLFEIVEPRLLSVRALHEQPSKHFLAARGPPAGAATFGDGLVQSK